MFNFFKKKKAPVSQQERNFEIELTGSILAYEIARADGEISHEELTVLMSEIKKIAIKVGKSPEDIFNILEEFSDQSVSFHEFIEDINKEFSKNEKLSLIDFLWRIAYADSILETHEERLVRRIADLIHIKDIEVLKIKDNIKNIKL